MGRIPFLPAGSTARARHRTADAAAVRMPPCPAGHVVPAGGLVVELVQRLLVSLTSRSTEVSSTLNGMPGRPPTLTRNLPRPGGSLSSFRSGFQDGGVDQ